MMEGTVVRADCVKIHENVIETGRDESHDRDEPSRSTGCAWGHAEPFIESVGGASGCRPISSEHIRGGSTSVT